MGPFEFGIYVAAGVVLAVLTLPWAGALSGEPNRPWMHLAKFSCFWLVLLVYGVVIGLRAYREAWREYRANRRAIRKL